MHTVTETTDLVGPADLTRCMDGVNHKLEIDRCVIGTQTGQTRIGAALVDVCHHRIVARHAYFGLVGTIVAVQRELVVAVVAFLYVDNCPSRYSVGVRYRRICNGIGYRDALQ